MNAWDRTARGMGTLGRHLRSDFVENFLAKKCIV